MVLSPSCSLHHYKKKKKKSSGRGFNQPAFLLLIPTCLSAREQSNRSLCDSLEICSPRALTGRTRVVVRMSASAKVIHPADIHSNPWIHAGTGNTYRSPGLIACYDQLRNYQHKQAERLGYLCSCHRGLPLLPLLLQQPVSKAISCFTAPLFCFPF